jgi:hypothetical protein
MLTMLTMFKSRLKQLWANLVVLGYVGLAVWFAADVLPSWARAMADTAVLWPNIKGMLFRYKAVQWQLIHRQMRENGGADAWEQG